VAKRRRDGGAGRLAAVFSFCGCEENKSELAKHCCAGCESGFFFELHAYYWELRGMKAGA